jgi:hypothetical protein
MTKVVNIRTDKYDIYCGRAGHGKDGYFGNLHSIGFCKLCNRNHDRKDCIEVFRQEFISRINRDKEFKKRIEELKNLTLGCFCKPNECHCDIYIDYLNSPEKYLAQIKNKVIIAGSRHIDNYELIKSFIQKSEFKIDEIVCGEAKGVDSCGKKYGIENSIPIKSFPAQWDKFGKSAGYKRNEEMAEYSTHLILIWDGFSKGSSHMLNLAKKYNLKIKEWTYNT